MERGDALLARLHERVVCDLATGCWVWTGPVGSTPYGQLNFSRKLGPILVHRLAYAIEHAVSLESLEGWVVMHLCNRTTCIRPSHLRLGTQRENMAFMRDEGRAPRGERGGNAKLTEADVRAIRDLWANNTPAPSIATQYGVSNNTIYLIAHGINWKHVQ
jgi:hypothetical protein